MGPQHRRPRGRPALPQRLRAGHAAEHALRRGRVAVPLGARSAARRPASSRTAPSAATSCTCATSPRPTSPPSTGRRTQPRRHRSAPSTSAAARVHTIGEMAEALAREAGGPAPVVTGEYRAGDVRHITASSERLRTELGWEPRRDVRGGHARVRDGPAAGGRDELATSGRRRPRAVRRPTASAPAGREGPTASDPAWPSREGPDPSPGRLRPFPGRRQYVVP